RKEQIPCPASLFAAFGDTVDEVRWQALVYIGLLKTFEPECVPVLIDYSKSKNPHVRSNAYIFLALAAPKDEKVRQLLRDAAASEKDDTASHDAHCSLHNATKKIEDLLPYFIHLWSDVDETQPPPNAQTAEQNERRARKNLFRLSTSFRMAEWAEDRPEELTRLLLEQLKSDKIATRRGLVHLLRSSAASMAIGKVAQRRPDPWDMDSGPSWTYFLLPYVEQGDVYSNIFGKKKEDAPKAEKPKAENPPPPAKAKEPHKIMVRMEELGLVKGLEAVRDADTDPALRKAAERTLKIWNEVRTQPIEPPQKRSPFLTPSANPNP
ncbi:MAG: HEAT repeat domain-containing protein, partial [Gemmataceae bacterium]|nr:HEAT repeat domain-containing protein [Gemmataceae bacterium]